MTEPTRLQPRKDGGPLQSLTERQYGFSSINYPKNIETISHCMLFNVNVHDQSKDLSSTPGARETIKSRENTSNEVPRHKQSDTAKFGLTRRTTRVKRAISLYVPETVVFDGRQNYDTPSLYQFGGAIGAAAATGASSLTSDMSVGGILGMLGMGGAVAAGLAVGTRTGGAMLDLARARDGRTLGNLSGISNQTVNVAKIGAQITGFALNPLIEVLYNSPQLRTFNFDFIFAPNSKDESDVVWQIIYEFRRHSSPEFVNYSGGLIFIPPSDFDITFMRRTENGFVENTNMPRISSCVLEDVQVDYAASGQFNTFVDGMPIQTRMRLQFKELDIITREKIDVGY